MVRRSGSFGSKQWFVPQAKTVTYHNPDLRFLAYGIGKNQITNNGFSVDYTASYQSTNYFNSWAS